MMKTIDFLFLLIVSLLLRGCPGEFADGPDVTIYIANRSTKDIYFLVKGGSVPKLYDWPPNKNYLIPAKTTFELKLPTKAFSNDSKNYIWLFDKETIDNIAWKDVVTNKMYLIRYDLTLDDLKAMNFRIIYTKEKRVGSLIILERSDESVGAQYTIHKALTVMAMYGIILWFI